MEATRGNKVYTINETQKSIYQEQGYDIVNDDGTVIEYGAGKSVSYEKYKALESEINTLKKENDKLKEENKKLKTENKELLKKS